MTGSRVRSAGFARLAATERPALEVGALLLAGLLIRLWLAPSPGHVVDMNTFASWAMQAADHPWDNGYEATNMNYPPAALLFFELSGRAFRALNGTSVELLRVLIKLPAILFDLLGGLVTYLLARRFVAHRPALAAAAIFTLNPAIIYDSAYWGQNDTITSVSALAAVWCMFARRRTLAWVVLAFAVLNKPPVVVLAPLFALEALRLPPAERRGALQATGIGVVLALLLGYVLSFPFYVDKAPLDVYERLITWYRVGSGLYPVNSANAFNIYGLFTDFFIPDTTTVALVPLKLWGDLFFIGAFGMIAWTYWRSRRPVALLEASFLAMLAFFLLLTEMHERYLVYALTLVPLLAVLHRRYLWSAGLLTLTQLLNLEYSMVYLWVDSAHTPGLDSHGFMPILIRLCALTNIAVFILGLDTFGDDPRAVDRPAPA